MRHRVLQRQRLSPSLSLPVHRMEMQLIRGATETKTPRNTTPVHVSPSLRLSVAPRRTPAEKQSSSSALALQSPREKEAGGGTGDPDIPLIKFLPWWPQGEWHWDR